MHGELFSVIWYFFFRFFFFTQHPCKIFISYSTVSHGCRRNDCAILNWNIFLLMPQWSLIQRMNAIWNRKERHRDVNRKIHTQIMLMLNVYQAVNWKFTFHLYPTSFPWNLIKIYRCHMKPPACNLYPLPSTRVHVLYISSGKVSTLKNKRSKVWKEIICFFWRNKINKFSILILLLHSLLT